MTLVMRSLRWLEIDDHASVSDEQVMEMCKFVKGRQKVRRNADFFYFASRFALLSIQVCSNNEEYMDSEYIYIKTPTGVDEVESSKLQLPARLRAMLIMVDGRKTVEVLRASAVKMGCPENFIESLLAAGLIARVGANAGLAASAPTAAPTAAAASRDSIGVAALSVAVQPAQDEYARFRTAKDFMNSAVVNSLGMKAFFFTLKLERAGTIDDLRALVKPFQEALTKATSAAVADALTKQLLEYLD